MLKSNLIAHYVGILSLITSTAIVFPTLLEVFKLTSNRKKTTWLIFRFGLLSTISLGLIHGLLMTQNSNIDFYALKTYWVYAGGIFALNLLIFLEFNSTVFKRDMSIFNYFNYAILLLLLCHVGQKILP